MEPAAPAGVGGGVDGAAADDNPAAVFFMSDNRCWAAAPRLAHSNAFLVLYGLSASFSFCREGCTAASMSNVRRRPAIAASLAVGLKHLSAGNVCTNRPGSSSTARIVLAYIVTSRDA